MLHIHFRTNSADFRENILGRVIAIDSHPTSFLVPLPRLRDIGL